MAEIAGQRHPFCRTSSAMVTYPCERNILERVAIQLTINQSNYCDTGPRVYCWFYPFSASSLNELYDRSGFKMWFNAVNYNINTTYRGNRQKVFFLHVQFHKCEAVGQVLHTINLCPRLWSL